MHPVFEGIFPGMQPHESIEGTDETADRGSTPGHAGIRSENEAWVSSAVGGPASGDRGEVRDIVGHQGPTLLGTDGKDLLVVLALPSPFDGCDDIVPGFS